MVRAILSIALLIGLTTTTFQPAPGWAKPPADHNVATRKSNFFSLMPFRDVARLEASQRAKYIHSLRELIIEVEKAQLVFDGETVAQNSAPSLRQQWPELFAILLPETANAEEDAPSASAEAETTDDASGASAATQPETSLARRGANPGEACISAYGLSQYPGSQRARKAGERQPFRCQPAPTCTTKSGGRGTQCGALSGLSDADGCISASQSWHATTVCESRRAELATKNAAASKMAQDAINKFFGSKILEETPKLDKTIDAKELTRLVAELAKYAYNDAAFAQLLKVIAMCKQNGIDISLPSTSSKLAAFIRPDKFQFQFDQMQNSIDQMMSAFTNHCDAPVDPAEIAKIQSPDWQSKVQKIGGRPLQLENQRLAAIKNAPANKNLRVRDVLEIDECRTLENRISRIRNQFKDPATTITPTPPAPAPAPAPAPPPAESSATTSVGCPSSVGFSYNHLEHSASRCMVCLAEKAAIKDEQNYRASTKWFGLMGTMAVACGYTTHTGPHSSTPNEDLSAEVTSCYMMAFGHCSQDDYFWKRDDSTHANNDGSARDENLDRCDAELVKRWQNTPYLVTDAQNEDVRSDYLENYKQICPARFDRSNDADRGRGEKNVSKGKIAEPDLYNDFVRIYGISYENALKLFCPEKLEIKKGWFSGEHVRSTGKSKPKFKCTAEWIANARANYKKWDQKDRTRQDIGGQGPSGGGQLRACLDHSMARAQNLYGDNGQHCLKTAAYSDRNGNAANAFNSMLDGLEATKPAAIFSGASCEVSKSVVTTTKASESSPSIKSYVFVDPKDVTKNQESGIRSTLSRGASDSLADEVRSNMSFTYEAPCSTGGGGVNEGEAKATK